MATPYVPIAAIPHRRFWECAVRTEPNERWIRVTGRTRPHRPVDVSTRPGVGMRSRREQVQAYRFLTRRIGSALLSGEPETTELPLRRFAYALFGGLVVGAVLVAGFGIYGLLVPGGRRPVEGAVIIERESGAKFL